MTRRRDFLKSGIGLAGLAALGPAGWVERALAQGGGPSAVTNKVLVVLQLDGGNDALNTVVPYTQGSYYDARPTIGIRDSNVLPLSEGLGLHPSLAPLLPLWSSGKLAAVHGIGYPGSNRSHFRSTDIWNTAEPGAAIFTGWLGRYSDRFLDGAGDLAMVSIGGALSKCLVAERFVAPSIPSLGAYQFKTDPRHPEDRESQVHAFLASNQRPTGTAAKISGVARSAYSGSSLLQSKVGTYVPKATYPTVPLGSEMRLAAQLIVSGVGTRVVHVKTSGGAYDTHAQQGPRHARYLDEMAGSVAAFQQDIEAHGLGDKVAILVFSEFGRRVAENGSAGSDHGAAGVAFLVGTRVVGGHHGAFPSLTNLDPLGNLVMTVDFRQMYATVLESWFGVSSQEVLRGRYTPLGLFRT